jgi:hypothetical protein
MPVQDLFVFEMPIAIANAMKTLNVLVAWKLIFTYSGNSGGSGNIYVNVIPDGDQQSNEIHVCLWSNPIWRSTGTTNGDTWIQIQLPVEVVWLNVIPNQLISVFWTATYQFGQNNPDLSYYISMDVAPSAWQQSGPIPASGCPGSGVGTAVTPNSWTLLPWSAITSTVS